MRLGDGEIFRGEGILAVTKAILQSGVAYVGGYQGAPVSHLVDVLVESQDLLDELGVHLETCTNEASAAALLGASINYPLRGCVTWKSIVGTNVAADALSNLASPGVIGGALIVVGEDYGEGASIIQERAHAYALKSSLWLMDPRPNLPSIVRCTEKAFELSEATNTPVMMELRIRACHVTGEFLAKDNKPPPVSRNQRLANPAPHNYDRISHPPSTYAHEKIKVEVRQPAAQRFIVEHGLNEFLAGERSDLGIIVQGGITNVLLRGLDRLEVEGQVPTLVLNVTHPLVPDQIADFCKGKRAVLIVEEGGPDYIEQAVHAILRKRDIDTKIYGKDVLPMAGEYTAEVVTDGLLKFFAQSANDIDLSKPRERFEAARAGRAEAQRLLGGPLPLRPPGFCVGCPERPVFSAIKLLEREVGKVHISSDIGCHSFATLAPFNLGNSILGFGMSLAAAGAVAPVMQKRTISVMGDGGFWHNGLLSGVASAMFNRGDRVLVIMQNGYTSATGAQFIPNTSGNRRDGETTSDIAATLKAMGVKWLRTIRTYNVATMLDDPARGHEQRRQGAEGHRRRRRMPARPPAPHPPADRRPAQARRARGAHALRRRRRGLHRRSLLHPPVGLPVAGGQAQPRSAALRSGGARQQRLRRLRPVRRGGRRRRALPVLLQGRHRAERDLVGPREVALPVGGDRSDGVTFFAGSAPLRGAHDAA